MFASRASTHLPWCFLSTDRVWPARVMDGPPADGVTTTVSLVHMKAQSPTTVISWISLVPLNFGASFPA